MPPHHKAAIRLNKPLSPMLPTLRFAWQDGLLLLLGYVALDWASYIHPLHGLNITPWSPAPALGLVFLLRSGKRAVPPLALAILVADAWVRDLPLPLPVTMALAVLMTLGYWGLAEVLRYRLPSGAIFADRRGLLEWAAIIVAGTGLISLQFISVLMLADGVPPNQAAAAFLRYWLGDMVGILATMPLLWMLADERGRLQLRTMIMSWESLGLVATGVALWLAFGLDEVTDFKYFYVLFLPIAWAAARKGLAGAVLITLFAQLGVIIETRLLGFSALALSEIQTLVLVLALSGFFIGVLVDEKQRLGAELRQTLRLAAAGEMAGALAHELNQPLTALAIYGKACERLLEQGETGERLREVIARMVAESLRAAEVVGRLRDFFRTGGTRLERIWLHELLSAAADRFTARAQQQGVELIIEPAPACALWADRLQLEVVLRNLLSNAFDAVAEQPTELRHIRLSTYPDGAGRIGICVEDSGAGLSGEMVARLFEPFQSSKASGLGLGLAISRAIIEAHGGSLWAEVTDHGLFRLVLPIEGTANDDS